MNIRSESHTVNSKYNDNLLYIFVVFLNLSEIRYYFNDRGMIENQNQNENLFIQKIEIVKTS